MFRFLDSWIVERTLFEFVNQGGCSCCGMSHGGAKANELMSMCSDWETDDGKREKKSPWPDFMRDEVWSERVRFRRALKEGLPEYRARFPPLALHAGGDAVSSDDDEGETSGSDDDEAGRSSNGHDELELEDARTSEAGFFKWFREELPADKRKTCFQMPREDLTEVINSSFGFKPAFQVVICAVIEQVANYEATGYQNDGATDAEVTFEECLMFERGAFVLLPEFYTQDDGLDILFERFRELGGDHLLPKRSEARRLMQEPDPEGVQTFRADRRLVRLVIARFFADQCYRKYKRARPEEAAALEAAGAALAAKKKRRERKVNNNNNNGAKKHEEEEEDEMDSLSSSMASSTSLDSVRRG